MVRSSILSEVSTRSRSKLPAGKNVLVLGDDGSGKTSLMAKLQGVEDYMKGRGLEYLYFSVHDEDVDDHARCNAWVLDGDLYHKGLQKFAVTADSLMDSAALLVVDISRPWTALESLRKWASVLREFIDKLRLPPEAMREMEQKLARRFQEYTEPGSDLSASHQRRNPTVTDAQEDGENKNVDVLYKYLLHSLYGFPFALPPQVVEKDAVFVPSGWDNEKKIAILHENFQTLKADDGFEDVIVKPPVRKFVHEKEVVAEDNQVFLVKLQSLLAKQPAVSGGRPVDASNRGPGGSPRTTNRSAPGNVPNVMPVQTGTKKIDPTVKGRWAAFRFAPPSCFLGNGRPAHALLLSRPSVTFAAAPPGGQTSEGVLANFFNSLLSKKTGSPGPAGSTPGGGGATPGTAKKSGMGCLCIFRTKAETSSLQQLPVLLLHLQLDPVGTELKFPFGCMRRCTPVLPVPSPNPQALATRKEPRDERLRETGPSGRFVKPLALTVALTMALALPLRLRRTERLDG
ncbi:cytoplasmic dynein 1 light intermediate chain 1-like [Scleropages formosus]|uniref:Dynein light intermediate chain n=1 Tax=Scleropages formosus TaxID=113540 RepID=A0A0P7TW13_SCLFO|nr:cytoplasmic dynein 1 light intermediate chain 1-like [Scleropages formosus]